MRVLIGGDIYLGGSLEKKSISNPESLFDELSPIFKNADLSIVNLECPLTDVEKGIKKSGPNIKASKESIASLDYLNVDLVTLANNHIMDYGKEGLRDTLTACERIGLNTVGAGLTREAADMPYTYRLGDKILSVVNFAENEWASANDSRGGANPMDIAENVRQIQRAKEQSDYVLAIVHGGHEHYEYPSPRMVSQYRFYAEQGASAVVGHHAHCVSGYEVHLGIPIFYNIGNLLFDSDTKDTRWFEGMLVELEFGNQVSFEVLPYFQSKPGSSGVHLMEKPDKDNFLSKLKELSEGLNSEELNRQWLRFVEKEYDVRQRQLLSKTSKFYRALGKVNLLEPFLSKRQARKMLNFIRCEAHRDLSIAVLEMANKKRK